MKFHFKRDVKIHFKGGFASFKKGENEVQKEVVEVKYFKDLVDLRIVNPVGYAPAPLKKESSVKSESKKA